MQKGRALGLGSIRRAMGEDYWHQLLKRNIAAEKAGERARVFCANMADLFEGHTKAIPYLIRLLNLIRCTLHFDLTECLRWTECGNEDCCDRLNTCIRK